MAWVEATNIQKRAHPMSIGTKASEKARLLALHENMRGVYYLGQNAFIPLGYSIMYMVI